MEAAFVHGLIAAEAGLARRTEQQRLRERKRLDDLRRRRDEAARRTRLWLVLHGAGPRIVASRGDHHVVVMKLETIDEALRVWDWMRWQRRSVAEWLVILDRKAPRSCRASYSTGCSPTSAGSRPADGGTRSVGRFVTGVREPRRTKKGILEGEGPRSGTVIIPAEDERGHFGAATALIGMHRAPRMDRRGLDIATSGLPSGF